MENGSIRKQLRKYGYGNEIIDKIIDWYFPAYLSPFEGNERQFFLKKALEKFSFSITETL